MPAQNKQTAAAITLQNITKAFGNKKDTRISALQNIDLEIKRGEFFVFLGPSGCGKSTLLRIMAGLESATEGAVQFAHDITAQDQSFVFQQFALLPWLTVYENIELNLMQKRLPEIARAELVRHELARLGLTKFAHAYPRELSGGMRQRVGIARAIVTKPKIIFMDEPFSELDSFTAERLRNELLDIWQNSIDKKYTAEHERPTIIMVTHLINEAITLADRIAVLTPRPGKIEKIISVRLARPRNKRSQEFFQLEDELLELVKP